MDQQTIDNKLLANFMGENINGTKYDYHKSWSWLMPVVNKIYKKIDSMEIDSTIRIRYEILGDALCSGDIFDAFNSVVELIKWYNKEKK